MAKSAVYGCLLEKNFLSYVNAMGVCVCVRPNLLLMLSMPKLLINKGQIPLRYLVADRSEAGRGPVADLLARASSLLAS